MLCIYVCVYICMCMCVCAVYVCIAQQSCCVVVSLCSSGLKLHAANWLHDFFFTFRN